MWSVILPDGATLEGVPELSFELNNQVFSSSDATALPGSFSFPFEVPLTRRNAVSLNHPHIVANASAWLTYERCSILLYGTPVFEGTLTIRSANSGRISLTIVANPMQRVKDTPINQLDLGGDRTTPSNIASHMDTVATSPTAFDYAFFPVYMQGKNLGSGAAAFQNYFDVATGAASAASFAITPFVKLAYLLSKMFNQDQLGYHFINNFQSPGNKELNLLYVYSNRDMRVSDGTSVPAMPDTFNLQDYLPSVKIPDALKEVMGPFNLGLFTNVFDRTIILEPLEDVLRRAPKYNWTPYVTSLAAVDKKEPAPNYYNYGNQGGTPPPDYPSIESASRYRNESELIAAFAGASPPRYGSYGDVFIKRQPLAGGGYVGQFGSYTSYGVVTTAGSTVRNPYNNRASFQPCASIYNTPAISRYEGTPADVPTAYEYRPVDYPFALTLYRGRQVFSGANNRPWATSSAYEPDTINRLPIQENGVSSGLAQHSLHWDGEYGLFNQRHARWNNMLESGKPIVQQFSLPVAQLLEFSFRHKIIVDNMEYVATRLRISKPLGNGRVQVEANLISVI